MIYKGNISAFAATLAISLVILCGGRGNAQMPGIDSYTKVGQKMPSISLTDTAGKRFSTAELSGKVAVVNFWATWCEPCVYEMPRLEAEVWEVFRSDADFAMVAIAREETGAKIVAFRNKHDFTFPMAADPDREVYKLFGNGGIPRTYVIGTDGTILYQSVAYNASEFDNMKKTVADALKKLHKSKDREK